MSILPQKAISPTHLAFAALITGSLVAPAADFNWNGTVSSDWADPANWTSTPGTTPSGTDLRINVGNSTHPTAPNRLIYSAAQGTTDIGSSSARGLFLGNGSGTVGVMEITGGVLNSVSNLSEGMSNGGGNSTLIINGGEYRKLTATGVNGVFSLNYGAGTSRLDIRSGTFATTLLNFQETDPGTTIPTSGTIQLDGGTLSVGNFGKTNTTSGSIHNVYLNGGTISSRTNASWGDLANVTWTLQSRSIFEIGHTVNLLENLGGTGGFEKTGTGSLNLNSAAGNTYTGLTTVTAGALVVSRNDSLGASGAGNGTEVATGARLVLNNGVTVSGESLTIAGDGAGGSFGALRASTDSTAIWDGNITVGSAGRIGTQYRGHLIVKGNIDASTVPLIIRTEGGAANADFDTTMVTLEGTYTGPQLTIFQGVVKLGASERISNSTFIQLGTTASTDLRQRLDLNGFNETVDRVTVSGSAASNTHEITNSAATQSTLTLSPSINTSYTGIVTGNLSITKNGVQSMSYSGINTYTGSTNVNAGTFNVTTEGAYNGGGSTLVASGATFGMAGTYLFNIGADGVNNSISGAGTMNLTGIFNINLAAAALADENSWQLVNGTGSKNWTGLRVTSTAGDFTRDAGLWTLAEGNNRWTFSEATGVLDLVVIPEPSQAMLILVGLAGCGLRRRRTA